MAETEAEKCPCGCGLDREVGIRIALQAGFSQEMVDAAMARFDADPTLGEKYRTGL